MMKRILDLCTIVPGKQDEHAVRVTVKAYLAEARDREQRMEARLMDECEYTILRGSRDGNFSGLLREVNAVEAAGLDETSIRRLRKAVDPKHRRNAVFLMNYVTLAALNAGRTRQLLNGDANGEFTLLDTPVVLTDAMPCADAGTVPILYGDFSQICIQDCGREELLVPPGNRNNLCVMTGYLNYRMKDKTAIRGIRLK